MALNLLPFSALNIATHRQANPAASVQELFDGICAHAGIPTTWGTAHDGAKAEAQRLLGEPE